jgi:hypothetical protein
MDNGGDEGGAVDPDLELPVEKLDDSHHPKAEVAAFARR